jgi:hypothetical protein
MGSGALQLTISLFAILGAAGLALFCDYLRHRNEELKTAMLAMQGGSAESLPASLPAEQVSWEPQPIQQFESFPARSSLAENTEAEPAPALPAPRAAQANHTTEIRSRRPRRRHPLAPEATELVRKSESSEAEIPSRETPEPQPAPAPLCVGTPGWLNRWAATRAAMPSSVGPAAHLTAVIPVVLPGVSLPKLASAPAFETLVPPAETAPTETSEGLHIDHKLWASMFQNEPRLTLVTRTSKETTRKEPAPQVVASRPPVSELVVPAGVQDVAVLSRLLASSLPYTGLAICISVNDMDEQIVKHTVTSFLTGLTRPGDMLCRSSKDEFVLLCPGERGPDSRRRLGAMSQQLWDYQLRNLGNFSVLFSWGSDEAWRARLSDAIEAARDSMSVTRRSREQQTEHSPSPTRRKAV